MNKERLLALAELLREVDSDNPQAFNMAVWGASLRYEVKSKGERFQVVSCGTVGCIAGWAAALAHLDPDYEPTTNHTQGMAIDYLDLAEHIHWALFTPSPARSDYSVIRAGMAADVVERLAETGRVEWP